MYKPTYFAVLGDLLNPPSLPLFSKHSLTEHESELLLFHLEITKIFLLFFNNV